MLSFLIDLAALFGASAWEGAIRRVEETARCGENLMPRIVCAVESYGTVGEISDAMRRVFGKYQETVVAEPSSDSARRLERWL